jgi:hypothetical protein
LSLDEVVKENGMDAKFVRNVKLKVSKPDQHIPPVAGAVFGLFLIAAVIGALWMEGKAPDGWIGA